MKYHALFVILKKRQNLNCRLQQSIGGALWVKPDDDFLLIQKDLRQSPIQSAQIMTGCC